MSCHVGFRGEFRYPLTRYQKMYSLPFFEGLFFYQNFRLRIDGIFYNTPKTSLKKYFVCPELTKSIDPDTIESLYVEEKNKSQSNNDRP